MFSLKSAFEKAQATSHGYGLSPLAIMFWMVAIDEDRQQREREKKRRDKRRASAQTRPYLHPAPAPRPF